MSIERLRNSLARGYAQPLTAPASHIRAARPEQDASVLPLFQDGVVDQAISLICPSVSHHGDWKAIIRWFCYRIMCDRWDQIMLTFIR